MAPLSTVPSKYRESLLYLFAGGSSIENSNLSLIRGEPPQLMRFTVVLIYTLLWYSTNSSSRRSESARMSTRRRSLKGAQLLRITLK